MASKSSVLVGVLAVLVVAVSHIPSSEAKSYQLCEVTGSDAVSGGYTVQGDAADLTKNKAGAPCTGAFAGRAITNDKAGIDVALTKDSIELTHKQLRALLAPLDHGEHTAYITLHYCGKHLLKVGRSIYACVT